MGILDRLRGQHAEDTEDGPVVEPPIDRDARRAQLDELEESLRQLARAMADQPERMANPGWRGRVEDYRYAANEAAHISRRGELAKANYTIFEGTSEIQRLVVARSISGLHIP